MTWEVALVVYVLILGGCIAGGVSLGASIGMAGIVGVTMSSGLQGWRGFGEVIFTTTTSFTLVSVPLFVLMGEIILRGGIAGRFYTGLSRLLSFVRGSLAFSNIFGCAVFSALCGSSVATALSVGTVALPEMRKRGYSDRLTFGTLTGGGCLGILIPPSIPMVIYGSMTNESVLDLFMAGILPGLLLTLLFAIYVFYRIKTEPELVPAESAHRQVEIGLGRAAADCLPVMALVAAIFFSMYFGVATPTEAAAVGCTMALFLAVVYRRFDWRSLIGALRQAASTTTVMMFITICAQVLSFAVVEQGVGRGVANAIVNSGLGPLPFFLLLFVVYLLLGMILDGLSMMLLTVPVLYPAMIALGFDGVWFGIIIVVYIELGALTPPVGLNLFAIQSISGGSSLTTIAWSSAPYAIIISAFCFLLYFVPQIVLYLPSTLRAH